MNIILCQGVSSRCCCFSLLYSEGLQDFMTQVRELYKKLLVLLMVEGLGVSPEFLAEDSGALRLNYYPPCPDPSKYIGLPEHADITTLTLLHQSEVGGLQVSKDGKWFGIRPRPDCFCVNVGDMGQVRKPSDCSSTLSSVKFYKTR